MGESEALDLAQRALRIPIPRTRPSRIPLAGCSCRVGRDGEALARSSRSGVSSTSGDTGHSVITARSIASAPVTWARRERSLKRIIDTTDARFEYATKASDLLRRIGS
jgi:hypothetical protein